MQEGIPSKRFSLWTRLYNRFILEPGPAAESRTAVGTTIVPVTFADLLLRESRGQTGDTPSITAAASGFFVGLTVPSGLRWHVLVVDFFRASGDNDVDQIRFGDVSRSVDVVISRFAGAANQSTVLGSPLPLDEGDTISVRADGTGAGATVFTVRAWVEEESAF